MGNTSFSDVERDHDHTHDPHQVTWHETALAEEKKKVLSPGPAGEGKGFADGSEAMPPKRAPGNEAGQCKAARCRSPTYRFDLCADHWRLRDGSSHLRSQYDSAKVKSAMSPLQRQQSVYLGEDARSPPDYHKVHVTWRNGPFSKEAVHTARAFRELMSLRQLYLWREGLCHPLLLAHCREKKDASDIQLRMEEGVFCVMVAGKVLAQPPRTLKDFARDLQKVWDNSKKGPCWTKAQRRLEILQKHYEVYELLNRNIEDRLSQFDGRDLYNICKVDNHIHLAAAMTARELTTFIKEKLTSYPTDVVEGEDGSLCTLQETFDGLNLHPDDFSVEALGVQGSRFLFQRFDFFNNSYNPFGHDQLRRIFLKTTNHQAGRYFAEITKKVFEREGRQGNMCYMEPRISVYGGHPKDWCKSAIWVTDHGLLNASDRVAWIIQVPRLYPHLRSKGCVRSYQEQLDNIFRPMFEATLYPEQHPKLANFLTMVVAIDSPNFLTMVVAIDSVDDESRPDELVGLLRSPAQWNDQEKPSYAYELYHLWANLHTFNQLRTAKGLNTIALRPHCGEAGPEHHLATAFLLAQSINHGVVLDNCPPLQYLYYLCQIGLSVSPLSNNALFVPLAQNPFPTFLQRGLNVALSTDDPLQFHTTQEPLMEEYTIARQLWKLSVTDLSEVARFSVLQSGFSDVQKKRMLGQNYHMPGWQGNYPKITNIPDCRLDFRHRLLLAEFKYIFECAEGNKDSEEDTQQGASSTAPTEERAIRSWQELASTHT
eukprot:g12402.t1